MKRGIRYYSNKFFILLISLGLIIINNIIAPLPNSWWYLPAIIIVILAIDSINNTYKIFIRYIKKDFSIEIINLISAEIFFFFVLILININYSILILIYVPLFWIASGLMRICLDATTFIYDADEREVFIFFKNFGRVRIASFFILAFLGLFLYYSKENFIGMAIFIPIYSIWLLGIPIPISHPVLRYLLLEEQTKIEIKIRRILYKKELTTKDLFKSTKTEDIEEFRKVIKNLEKRKIIKHVNRRWSLCLRKNHPRFKELK